jgi:hypothetical protein
MTRLQAVFLSVLVLGTLAAQAAAAQTILFDNGHGERFVIGAAGPLQLSGLSEICQATGARVAPLQQPISDATLAGADGLIITGAFAPLAPDEIDAVLRFMQRGGKLAVMLHSAPPLATLLDRLGIAYSNGAVRETENIIDGNPLDFRARRLGSHPVLQGVTQISLYGAWGLVNRDDKSRIIAATTPAAWIDFYRDGIRRKETTASFGVVVAGAVGTGGFVVFGDDAIFQNKFLDGNKALAANLARWLN